MTDKDMLAGLVRGLEWSEVDDFAPIKAWAGKQAFCRFTIRRIITPDGVFYRSGKDVDFASLELAQKDARDYYMSLVSSAINPDAVLALVAAAYADAVSACDDLGKAADWPACNQYERAGTVIDRRTPTDATAALERMLADARAEGYAQAQRDECGCRLGEDCAICDARAMKGENT